MLKLVFDLSENAPFIFTLQGQVSVVLFSIGTFDARVFLGIGRAGLVIYGEISADLFGDFGRDIGLEFNASATLEFNTTSETVSVTFFDPVTGAPEDVDVESGFALEIQGSVEFLGFASASGRVFIGLQNGAFTIEFDVTLQLGGLEVRAIAA